MFLTWNIFGDPSVRVRTDTPAPVTVNHITVIYPSMTDFAVEVVGVEDALCALYGDGVLYGSAMTDATGNATVPIGTMPPVGQTLTLTVTGFNTETYTSDIPVIVPVTYDISPATIPVSATTPVTITVWDSESAPLPNVEITVDGWGIDTLVDVTDAFGEAHFSLMPPYGEDLTVVASEIGESYNCFEDVIPTTGASDLHERRHRRERAVDRPVRLAGASLRGHHHGHDRGQRVRRLRSGLRRRRERGSVGRHVARPPRHSDVCRNHHGGRREEGLQRLPRGRGGRRGLRTAGRHRV